MLQLLGYYTIKGGKSIENKKKTIIIFAHTYTNYDIIADTTICN